MRKDDIPQDDSKLSDKNMKELCYAVDKNGNYTTGLSTGWEAKSIALDLTIKNLDQQIEEAKNEVLKGQKSPIYYFMIREKMDIGILAGYMSRPKWIIKRHFKPHVFEKLKISTVKKYADIFSVDETKLTKFNE
ncbi:hypothetical protein [Brumimicrobium aurantiacum]|uniref:Uncharacterized protein n=1 Tax=Brumimicrobium aurantiacum TaxID=1737063 RepID=A0A3E1EZD2_9FLAO|nr:hypothetical protein [Brumimicrobium aurantiacum]RFC54908.1 hypothetical protein DXU93_03545 [Brumimicrobium aurantiacum]